MWNVSEITGAATVTWMLKLDDQSVRVAQIDFGRAFTHFDLNLHRTDGGGAFDAMVDERLDGVVDREVFDRDAELTDARRHTSTALPQRQKLRPRSDAQTDGLSLARLNGHAEEPLVELDGPFHVRHVEGHLIEPM